MKIARKDLLDKINYLKPSDLEDKITLEKIKRLYNFKGHDSLLYRFYITLNISISPDERQYYEEVIQRLEEEEKQKCKDFLTP